MHMKTFANVQFKGYLEDNLLLINNPKNAVITSKNTMTVMKIKNNAV